MREVLHIAVDADVSNDGSRHEGDSQQNKVLAQQQAADVGHLCAVHLTKGYLAVALADVVERQPEQPQAGDDDGYQGKGDDDARHLPVFLVQAGYLVRDERILKVAPAHSLLVEVAEERDGFLPLAGGDGEEREVAPAVLINEDNRLVSARQMAGAEIIYHAYDVVGGNLIPVVTRTVPEALVRRDLLRPPVPDVQGLEESPVSYQLVGIFVLLSFPSPAFQQPETEEIHVFARGPEIANLHFLSVVRTEAGIRLQIVGRDAISHSCKQG